MDLRLMMQALQIAYLKGAVRGRNYAVVPPVGSPVHSQDMGEILAEIAKLQGEVKS